MKKILLALLLVSVVLVAACSQTQSETTDKSTGSDTTTGSSTNNNPTTPSVKKFTMTAKQWEFIPSTITVNEGDEVELTVKSIDVTHGFSLPTFGVSEILEPEKTTTINFVASKKGTFTFFCSVQCGTGHKDMKGTLIVQ